jgi:aminobenzoyl-glutamate transport protein
VPRVTVDASRYDKRSGTGTVIALMLPYFMALTIVWTLFFVVWHLNLPQRAGIRKGWT